MRAFEGHIPQRVQMDIIEHIGEIRFIFSPYNAYQDHFTVTPDQRQTIQKRPWFSAGLN